MRPFASWPRWALVFFIGVLRRVGVLPGLLFSASIELWRRDVADLVDDDHVAWWCPTVGIA